ncbi:TIGR01777 family oxidoreductase [Colwellia sp. 1_MG-2023]|uniref:TIGR01777 family oxidoreductase n=1 Tax=unclassified Colwellia TaxID=196834 RepID=UPI001C08B126|nr:MULTISPECIES: TIGR01777 family oxidoreductase [unclassified Colwellia]MBU2925892.1 TIGR01777 family oxidoreductase [Colwellia sp. C2M11]MDO6489172.1 TIGR01777 family oxidoreductase [Colwellia sp. 6_MG-2023]MDO6652710.1 TIGR01777 family oxidoreductase [Colwellia sp. 3_MG-2023]MDO6665585.1 TIGR01777 family oxidoreductase [Colwellia sp. 2_MG-2023]MDO6689958.1 TIGR01777 family oxidoreductase [Colwellia sp. 1_MG-2023]
MNVLITGGTGLIGKALIKVLRQSHTNITVLTRNCSKAVKTLGTDINVIDELNLSTIENIDTVINLAGEPIANKRWSVEQKKQICQSRWDITEKLSTLIKTAKNPPSLFISGSAIGIYGRQGSLSIDEEFTDYHREFTYEVCSKWENLALAAKSENTRIAILRTGIVLDKHEGAIAKMLLPFKLCLGGKISHGQQMMSWIHIDDMVAAILHIQKTPSLKGFINITAEQPVSNNVFSRTLAKTLNRPCMLTTPAFILKLIFGEMADLLLFGQNVKPTKLKNSGFRFTYPSIDSALKNLLTKKL